MKKAFCLSVILVMLTTASAWGYFGMRPVQLKGLLGGEGSSGEVTFERMDFMPGLRSMGFIVYGLKPNSVYSVWFSGGPKGIKAAGVEANHFGTDGSGKGRYVTTVYEDQVDDWRYIDINLHPDGNPSNTKDMVPAMRGDLYWYY